jgi:hypothetical protein
MKSAVLVSAAVALSFGCKRSPPPPARYCDQDLSGVWVNATDRAFAYRLEDHGDSVRGKYFHRDIDGGEAPPHPGEDALLIDLRRTPTALAGTMTGKAETRGGRRCDVQFALRVSSCQPDALQVVAETAYDVREDCSRQKNEDGGDVPAQLVEFRWERAPAAKAR